MDTGRLLTAMATPFTENNQLDTRGIHRLVDHLITTGTTALVVCGTTGETPTLSHSEKLAIVEETLKAVRGRVPVIAGSGSNDTAASVALTREMAALGVDGIMVVTPYYNRPSQEGLYAHFAAVAEAVDLPVMLYNVPSRTGCRIEVPTILRLARVPNVWSIKEASGDLAHIMRLCAEKPDDLLVYSGDDKLTLPILSVGGIGVVSVASHVVGREMTRMIDHFIEGDHRKAATMNARLLGIFESLFHPGSASPAQVKWALERLGICRASVRLPLVGVPDEVAIAIGREMDRLGYTPSLESAHA